MPAEAHPWLHQTGRRRWLAVGVFALVVRLLCQALVGYQAPPVDDAYQFDTIAWSLSQGGEYVTVDGVRSSRAPAYPFLLAGIYRIFGHSWPVARVVQALLGAATCALLVSIAGDLFDPMTGVLAGLTLALFPYAVYWTTTLLSETLSAFLALLATWALGRTGHLEARWVAGWSAACGLATLARPNLALLFVLGLPIVLAPRPFRVRRCLLASTIFFLVLLPWTVRNYRVHHRAVFVTTMGGRVLWEGNNPYVAASTDQGRSSNSLDLPEARLVEDLSEADADAFYFRLAVTWIRDHPGPALSLMKHKAIRLFNPQPDLPSRMQRGIASLSTVLMLVFFLSGIALSLRWRDGRVLPFLVPIAAIALTGLIYWADARIRAPADPEIAVVASIPLAALGHRAVAGLRARRASA